MKAITVLLDPVTVDILKEEAHRRGMRGLSEIVRVALDDWILSSDTTCTTDKESLGEDEECDLEDLF